MTDQTDSTSGIIHIYRPEWWIILLNIFLLIFMGVFIASPLLVMILPPLSIYQAESEFGGSNVFLLCFLTPFVVATILLLILGFLSVIGVIFSYIKITSGGVEQKIWPFRHVRCTWSEVDKIGKYLLLNDVIYLTSSKIIGPSLSFRMPFNLFIPRPGFITLTGYHGWADGELAQDLRRFAARLFESETEIQASSLNGDGQVPVISQEERLLATLSHASVLFSGFGILVPLLIWATQKKSSTYVRFHALQALIWQGILQSISFVLYTCMMLSMFVPLLIAGSAPPEELPMAWFLVFVLILLFLPLGTLVFIVYGIVGAILTYQDKIFGYVVVAKSLEKRGLGLQPHKKA